MEAEMTIEELRKLLTTDIITVTFTKKDKSKRKMICTTIGDYLPGGGGESTSKPNDSVVTVWDLEQQAWRSFKFDSITSVDSDYFNYAV